MDAVTRVKAHFDQVNSLWQSREAKEWQARLSCESIGLAVMGLTQQDRPPNFYIITTKVLEHVINPNNPIRDGEVAPPAQYQAWLSECDNVIKDTIAKDGIDLKCADAVVLTDPAHITALVHRAQRLVFESKNPVEKQELTELVGNYQLSETYQRYHEDIINRMIERLDRSGDLDAMIQIWPKLDNEERLFWLQKQINILAEIQSECTGLQILGTKVQWKDGMNIYGEVNKDLSYPTTAKDVLNINAEKDILKKSLSAALDCALHEQYHQLHNQLARDFKLGRIDSSHPLYEDALYFHMLWERDGYIAFGQAYKVQPDERYAIKFSDTIARFINNYTDKPSSKSTLVKQVPAFIPEAQELSM